jgi:hypothetical protein
MGQYVAWHARKLYNSLPEKSYEFVFSQIWFLKSQCLKNDTSNINNSNFIVSIL